MARMVFDTDSDPGMQVVATSDSPPRLVFSNQDDWCGSTESGFGATVAIELKREQVAQLHAALGEWLGEGS